MIVKADDGWLYHCDIGKNNNSCGGDGYGFISRGWSSKELAEARGAQHEAEHETKVPMQALHEFEEDHGLREKAE